MAEFHEDGIGFCYPDNWTLQREQTDSGWTVSVQSPQTAFLLVSFDPDMPEPEHMAQTALDALRAEYPDLEADERVETIAGQPAIGHDIRFFSLDLTNTCGTRSFDGGGGTVLLLWQANDLELDEVEPIFRAVVASLHVEEE